MACGALDHPRCGARQWSRRAALSLLLALGCAAGAPAAADPFGLSGAVTTELRLFPRKPAFPDQERVYASPSLAIELKATYDFDDNQTRLVWVGFGRVDAFDDNRSHADIREAKIMHRSGRWDAVAGFDRVFWGVAESRHLVDIINQTDAVEDIDLEDKLGQPMINLNRLTDYGEFGLFVLPGFRERTLPGKRARLRGPLPLLADARSPLEGWRSTVDAALRYTHTIGPVDLGLAHFHGLSREPRFVPVFTSDGRLALRTEYDRIDQTSIDAQASLGPWLLKFEGITRSGQGDRFQALVGGFEYTLFDVGSSGFDLGLLAEYLYDGRGADAPLTVFDHDIFAGTRLTFNDIDDTEVLAGLLIDRVTGAMAVSIEAERRIAEEWKAELDARFFFNVPESDPLTFIRRDGFFSLRLTRFF